MAQTMQRRGWDSAKKRYHGLSLRPQPVGRDKDGEECWHWLIIGPSKAFEFRQIVGKTPPCDPVMRERGIPEGLACTDTLQGDAAANLRGKHADTTGLPRSFALLGHFKRPGPLVNCCYCLVKVTESTAT